VKHVQLWYSGGGDLPKGS